MWTYVDTPKRFGALVSCPSGLRKKGRSNNMPPSPVLPLYDGVGVGAIFQIIGALWPSPLSWWEWLVP